MYLVHVYPISRGIAIEHLTYFSREEPKKGSFVRIMLRGTATSAVVVRTESAQDAKARVRTAGHALVKIQDPRSATIVHTPYLAAAAHFARDTAATIGAVLDSVIPKAILTHAIAAQSDYLPETDPLALADAHEFLCIQATYVDRVAMYRTLARECIAKKESIVIVAPTVREAERLHIHIRRGIEGAVVLISAELSPKNLVAAWKSTSEASEPRVVIVVGSCLGVPVKNLSCIVVEREGAHSYVRESRPFVDLRSVAELYAKGLGIRYIVGDTVLRSAVRSRLEDGSVIEYAPRSMTVQSTAKIQLVDMRPYKKDKAGNYRALSAELITMLQDTERANNRTFILAGRRGLASSVTCGDCGTAVVCSKCSTPYTLTASGEIRTQRFLCTKCGFQARTDVRCSACDSWRLVALGAGSQKIAELLQIQFPNRAVFRVDSDITKTPSAVRKVVEAYEHSTSGILVATELVLPYLPETVPYAAVSSIDSLLAVPELGVDERVFALLMRLREMTQVSLIIQSRTPERSILLDVVSGDIEGYATAELARRRELAFPPFSTFITISKSGKPTPVETAILTLMQTLSSFEPVQLPQVRSRVYTARILVRVSAALWPHRELLQKLRSLDPSFSVHVGTENLFA